MDAHDLGDASLDNLNTDHLDLNDWSFLPPRHNHPHGVLADPFASDLFEFTFTPSHGFDLNSGVVESAQATLKRRRGKTYTVCEMLRLQRLYIYYTVL
jgi:hypothetical protein